MLVILSHVLAFSTLFIASIWDLYTTDVPDFLGVIGVLGGIGLHAAAAYATGSLDPLIWSFGAGIAFSIFGWGMYLLGMWGGADAFAMSVLGFAAPYGLEGTGILHGVNLLVNVMIVGMVYSLLFAAYKAFRSDEVVKKTFERVKDEERKIATEILAAAVFSGVAGFAGLNGLVYFVSIVFLIFLYRFLKVLENEEMTFDKQINDLEPGDVVSLEGLDVEDAREKNYTGEFLACIRVKAEFLGLHSLGRRLELLEERLGYPEVVGITEEEINHLEDKGVDTVEIKTGARFVPVFPMALLLTDVFGGGIIFLVQLF